MKKMVYGPKRIFKVLDKGTYRNIPYWIVSRGTHPCCYIDVTKYMTDHGIKDVEGDDGEGGLELDCHGDISYTEDHLDGIWDKTKKGFVPKEKTFVGWHYLHTGDHGGEPHFDEIMNIGTSSFHWTTEELLHDLQRSIDTLFPYESKYGLNQMVYKGRGHTEVLGSGVLNGVPWWIVSYGSHPCAYFEVTGLTEGQSETIECLSHEYASYKEDHLSFAGWDNDTPGFEPKKRKFIGWDYAHLGDYTDDTPPSGLGKYMFDTLYYPEPKAKKPEFGAPKEEILEYLAKREEETRMWRMFTNSRIHEGHRWSSDEIYEEVRNAIEQATEGMTK